MGVERTRQTASIQPQLPEPAEVEFVELMEHRLEVRRGLGPMKDTTVIGENPLTFGHKSKGIIASTKLGSFVVGMSNHVDAAGALDEYLELHGHDPRADQNMQVINYSLHFPRGRRTVDLDDRADLKAIRMGEEVLRDMGFPGDVNGI